MKVRNMYTQIIRVQSVASSHKLGGIVSLSRNGKFWRNKIWRYIQPPKIWNNGISRTGLVSWRRRSTWKKVMDYIEFLFKLRKLKTVYFDNLNTLTISYAALYSLCTWLGTENSNVTKSITRLVNCIDSETAKWHISMW